MTEILAPSLLPQPHAGLKTPLRVCSVLSGVRKLAAILGQSSCLAPETPFFAFFSLLPPLLLCLFAAGGDRPSL